MRSFKTLLICKRIFWTITAAAAAVILLSCSATSQQKQQEQLRREVVQEIRYGRLISKQILMRYPLYKNEKLTLYVNKVGKSVALFAGRPELEYHFSILNSDSVNAFAAPGGYIFITKGAIKLMHNEAQLAAVLAHEIGHVNNRHIMKQLPPPREAGVTGMLASIMLAQGTVISSAMSETVSKASTLLFEKGYLIKDEYEADRSAIAYLDATGYDPKELITFITLIDRYKTSHKKTEVYHTHPPNGERIKRINSYIQEQKISSSKRETVKWRFKEQTRNLR